MHWACEECLVRACCTELCYLTTLGWPRCLTCEKNQNCKEKCDSVILDLFAIKYKDVFDKLMIDNMKRTNIFYILGLCK